MTRLGAVVVLSAALAAGCGSQCLDTSDVLFAPRPDEYRLLVTNGTGQMVEVSVDGRSLGFFCSGVSRLHVGNFRREVCSRITARTLDVDRRFSLDDCEVVDPDACRANNETGHVCYDTTRNVIEVEARLR